jgi:hypothetical protein
MLRLNLRKINQLIREAWDKGQDAALRGHGKSSCYSWSLRVAQDYFPNIRPVYAEQIAQGKARLHWDAEKREVVVVSTTADKSAETNETETQLPPLPLIRLRILPPDGIGSETEVAGEWVTSAMLDAAEDLHHTLTTGERPAIKNLYDLVARAFGTTHEDAKERMAAAAYGMSSQRIEQRQRVSPIDRRRLDDGQHALTLPDPQTDDEARAQLEIIHASMCALQSLDDLGEEGNLRAQNTLQELETRYEAIKASLKP